MKMTVVLFQIDFDRFSAMAVDLDHRSNVWRTTFDSSRDLLRRLDLAGVVTATDKRELEADTWPLGTAPILRVTVHREAIEDAGFEPVKRSKPN
jgi:hypothetical protein